MNSQELLVRLSLVLLLIFLNAFFVTAEFSIVSVRRSRISQLVQAGDVPAQTVQSLQRSIERLLSTTQLGITLASLALGWIGESTMGVLISQLIALAPLPSNLTASLAHLLAVPIAFVAIAYLQIVLGELCPKSVALIYSEQLARFFGPPSLTIARVFNPFIWILNQSTRLLLKTIGIEYTNQAWYNRVTSEELRLMIATDHSTGLHAQERKLLNNVFEFGEVLAEEVMIPRTSMKSVSVEADVQTLFDLVAETGYSRYPVIGESLDDIVGIVDFKDLAIPLSKNQITQTSTIKPWVKPVQFIAEDTQLKQLLAQMQASAIKMAIVADEFGGTSGLVTFQDIVAEIVGGQPNHPAAAVSPTTGQDTYLVPAQTHIEEVNQLLKINLPITEEYHTLGGFLLDQFQKIPVQGESLIYDGWEFMIIKAIGPKLYQVRISPSPSFPVDSMDEESYNRNGNRNNQSSDL